jgi:nitrite reductase/ring-hydroxylating ferredoxin subunit/Fe-S cluster biogenesis protein NfuA
MATSTAPVKAEEFEELAGRVDRAIAGLQALDAESRTKALAVKDAIEQFHKAGLTKIVHGLKADERGLELLIALAAEPEVYALFSMHGLIRADLPTRVTRVIEMARPYIKSHGGDVELDRVEGTTVWVKMHGACNGCSQQAVTLRDSVEQALREQVPEIEAVEVIPNEPSAEQVAPTPPTPVQLVQIITGPLEDHGAHGWVKGPKPEEISETKPYRWEVGEHGVVLVRVGEQVQAFRNQCAHQGLPLDGGSVDPEARTITCPWHGFRFDSLTGECLTAPQAQLQLYPLRITDGHVWVLPQ